MAPARTDLDAAVFSVRRTMRIVRSSNSSVSAS